MLFRKNKGKNDINREHFPLDLKVGLTDEQVEQRVEENLINKAKKHVTKSYLRIVYENLVNFFNILLILITIVMIIAKVPIKSYAFLVILIANVSIGLYQDIKARKLIDKLKVVSSVRVNTLRNGEIKSLKANELVYGDIVELKAGSQLVCDGEIVDGFIEVNESLLTGEPINISKNVGDAVYSGSFATSGYAFYRINRLGKENYAEKLQQKAKKFKRTKSEILFSIKNIFRVIGFFVVALAVAQIIPNRKVFKNIPSDAFTEAVSHISASLIAMIPIGMYLLTSVTLAVGVIRLVKRNMLTQDMYCIEMLARVDTLCLDKTGTLTDGDLHVNKVVTTSDVSERDIAKIVYTLVEETKDDNSTARAIRKEFDKLNKFDAYSAIPFSSDRKYSAVMLEDGRSIVMGAREFIPHTNTEVDELCKEYEKRGSRVLVLAVHSHVISINEPLETSTVIGFIVLEDHIRDDAPENIKWFKENGVSIRIITGDNPEAAAEIARRAGIEGYDKMISLEGMPIEEVRHIARDYVIFGRVTPEQKEIIVEALKDDGRTVAMTGDGVNDILALRVADCSIAMASGSDAAKNVSHLVSMDSNFSALPDVVKEGRRVINNLQRAVSVFLVKTVFAIFVTTLFITGALKYGVDGANNYAFSTNNLYIWELLNIGIGSLFLSLQPNDEQIKSKFLINILTKVIPAAFVQILIVVFFFLFEKDQETARVLSTLTFTIFSFVILVRICWPFDVYRLFLVVGLGFIDIIVIFSDFLAYKGNSFLEINYDLLTKRALLMMGIVAVVSIILYICFEILAIKLHDFIDKKHEEKNYDHF